MRLQMFESSRAVSERTDRLVMMCSVNDLAGASAASVKDPTLRRIMAESSKLCVSLSPFLSRKHIMVNSGVMLTSAIRGLMFAARAVVSQAVLDKISFVSSRELPKLLGVRIEALPEFLGGCCPMPATSPLCDEQPEVLPRAPSLLQRFFSAGSAADASDEHERLNRCESGSTLESFYSVHSFSEMAGPKSVHCGCFGGCFSFVKTNRVSR